LPGMPPRPGLPGLPGMGGPGMPPFMGGGMPPGLGGGPGGMNIGQAMAAQGGANNPDMVAQMTRWAADAYDQAKNAGIAPEVAELA